MKKTVKTLSQYGLTIISIVILGSLAYTLLFYTLITQRQQQSLATFEDIYYELTDNLEQGSLNIEDTLLAHVDRNEVSYQVMVMTPSELPFIHSYRRTDQQDISFFTLPYWSDVDSTHRFYHNNYKELIGWMPLPNGYQAYVQVLHPPITFTSLPPMHLLLLFAILLLLGLAWWLQRRQQFAWQYIIEYSQRLPTQLTQPYQTLDDKPLTGENNFLRLSHSLNRINQHLHKTYRARKALEKRLLKLEDFSPLPILFIDIDGEITYFNKRFEQRFLTVFQAEVRYFVTDFITGKDKITQQAITRIRHLQSADTYMVVGLETNTDYLLHIQPWTDGKGDIQGFCGILTDISNFTQELQEVSLKVYQQAHRLAEFDKLWSVLGHELRTPLGGMLGLLEVMHTNNFDDSQRQTYESLTQTGQSMLTLLNDMLDMAKMEAGKLQVVNERINIEQMCQQLMELMSSSARHKQIELLCFFEPRFPRYLQTDSGRLRQSLMNLISNAIKFTQTGYVALIAKPLANDDPMLQKQARRSALVQRYQDNPWVCFSIKDTGIGISAADMGQLFTRFNQANDRISLQFGGTGLGLAISNSFVQLLGGFIDVDSRLGEGSTFNVCLPLIDDNDTDVTTTASSLAIASTTHEPVYLPTKTADVSSLCLLAICSQQITTERLKHFADYMGFECLAYTGLSTPNLLHLSAEIGELLTEGKKLVVMIEEEVYADFEEHDVFDISNTATTSASNRDTSNTSAVEISTNNTEVALSKIPSSETNNNVEQLFTIPAIKKAPKILSSMQPRHSISAERSQPYHVFLTKPLFFDELLTQMLALVNTNQKTQPQFNISDIQAQKQHNLLRQTSPNTVNNHDNKQNKVAENSQTEKLQMIAHHLDSNYDTNYPKESTEEKSSKYGENSAVEPNKDKKTPCILITEDNKVNQMVARKLIKKLGYHSVIANNGEEAVQLMAQMNEMDAEDKTIKLILMDCNMPIMDGFEATRRIRQQHQHIPIVALTAGDTEADAKACLQAGMNSVLAKPITKTALQHVLQTFKLV